ncbi:hypothetical protein SmJEL517_g00672 [Synchytrium microbalum]|uniref:DNA repair protein RAD16 n=1 Tax=Synchytrium microbalum TaxID=1806994 RepID=A0A507CDZ9_9FUNG|nr:uncharacterized protein SmJEL517_g00672 [Synchytrium microbalum]TPX37568.1 hypothetical protein SmJEL517_g00672 [Synchytrium microbalum]
MDSDSEDDVPLSHHRKRASTSKTEATAARKRLKAPKLKNDDSENDAEMMYDTPPASKTASPSAVSQLTRRSSTRRASTTRSASATPSASSSTSKKPPASKSSKLGKPASSPDKAILISEDEEEQQYSSDGSASEFEMEDKESEPEEEDDDDEDDFQAPKTTNAGVNRSMSGSKRNYSSKNAGFVVDDDADVEEEDDNDVDEDDDDDVEIVVSNPKSKSTRPVPAKDVKGKQPAVDVKGKKPALPRKRRIVRESSDDESLSEHSDSGDDEVVAANAPVAAAAPEAAAEAEQPVARRRRRPAAPRRPVYRNPMKGVYKIHPHLETVWNELRENVKPVTPEMIDQPEEITVKLLPFQREGVHWLQAQEESNFHGGILADEMGMGKTIQMISLLVTRRDVKPNLIICPTVALLQWYAEFQERTVPDLLKVLVFHGANRITKTAELEAFDVVLTTYSIIESGHRKQHYGFKRQGQLVKEKSILHKITWGRVILDEAHAIKDRSSSTARAVFALDTTRRWSMTGTPLQNRVGELYSLIRFLDAKPFSMYYCKDCPCQLKTWSFQNSSRCECGHTSHRHFCWWNAEILKPIQAFGSAGEGRDAFGKLGLLLDRIMIRRTKVEKADDLGLPPRIVSIRRDVFNEAEEELYESLYTDSQTTFSTYVRSGTVLNNYASIFSLLSRMRLAVNHPDLVLTKLQGANSSNPESLVCGICSEVAEDAIVSKCKHIFCREDIKQYIESAPDDEHPRCPVCSQHVTIDLSQPTIEPKEESRGSSGSGGLFKTSIVNKIDLSRWRSSTKIEALVEELTKLRSEDHTSKSIVFSQFVSFLDLIQWRLSRGGFSAVKLDGRMGPEARASVIRSFMTNPEITVFLVSLKAGGVALNLTEASNVFIMDPWWNPSVEDQAFDRIHRLGQVRPIKITRLIIENSIESRIIQLQEKKAALFQSAIGKDMDALAKLSEEDLQFLFVL